MKYINKINIIIIILLLISLIFSNYSQASEIGDIFSSADNFLNKGNAIGATIDESQLKETSNFMYKLLMSVGIIVMFIVGTVIGIQYMVASAEDKAKVKEALVPYIVGCFVIFGAFTIWSIAVNIGQDMTKTNTTTTTTTTTSTTTTSTTYSKDANGTLYCDNCGDSLGAREQRSGKCANCGLYIKGI